MCNAQGPSHTPKWHLFLLCSQCTLKMGTTLFYSQRGKIGIVYKGPKLYGSAAALLCQDSSCDTPSPCKSEPLWVCPLHIPTHTQRILDFGKHGTSPPHSGRGGCDLVKAILGWGRSGASRPARFRTVPSRGCSWLL